MGAKGESDDSKHKNENSAIRKPQRIARENVGVVLGFRERLDSISRTSGISGTDSGQQDEIPAWGIDLIFPHHEAEVARMESPEGIPSKSPFSYEPGVLMRILQEFRAYIREKKSFGSPIYPKEDEQGRIFPTGSTIVHAAPGRYENRHGAR